MLIIIICVICGLFYLVIISAFSIGWFLTKYYHTSGKKPITKVSIIVAARNEEVNIENCLNDLIKQEYPKELFEIIVINDASTDRTKEKIENYLSSKFKDQSSKSTLNFKLETLNSELRTPNSELRTKKAAITLGINQAIGDLIIITDADCRMGSKWLCTLVDYYEINKPKMLIAPVCMKNDYTFFKKLQTIEFLSLIASSAGAAKLNLPVMCNGANLVYEKKAFYEVDGFKSNQKYSSGDDVFLMSKINKKYPSEIHFIKNKDVIVYTDAKDNISEFISQRKRWVSKTKGYKSFISIFTAIVVYLFNLSLLILFILGLFQILVQHSELRTPNSELFLVLFLCKSLIDYPILSGISSFMNKKYFFKYFVPLEFFNIFYVSIIGFIGSISSYEWKGRTKLN